MPGISGYHRIYQLSVIRSAVLRALIVLSCCLSDPRFMGVLVHADLMKKDLGPFHCQVLKMWVTGTYF